MSLSPKLVHLLLFSGGLLLTVGSLVWTRRNAEKIATTEFTLFLVVSSCWILVQMWEVISGRVVAYYATFLIRALRGVMVLSWFYFTMTYAGYRDVVHSIRVQILVGSAACYLILATSVPPIATEFIFPVVETHTEPFVRVSVGGMTPFRRTTQTVGYSLAVIGTATLTYRFLTTGYTRRWRPVAFLLGLLFVVGLDLVAEKRLPFLSGIDYASLGMAALSVLLILIFYRYDQFGSTPVGRDHLFRVLDEPIFVIDRGTRILDCNEAAKTLCRGGAEIGSTIDDAVPGETNIGEVVASDAGGQTIEIEIDSETRYYEVAVSAITGFGETGKTIVGLNDITTQKQQREELRRQNKRLEEFASVVSHDLRSPLTVANNRVQLAQQQRDDEHLDRAVEAHERMEELIDELLLLAKGETTRVEKLPVSLTEICERCWETVETNEATLQTAVERQIRADPNRLQQAIENLIRNAVEHGGPGVTITVGELPNGFYLSDDGPGIPDEMRGEIFEQGYSTADSGTGLGLAIVKEIVTAHEWDITVQSADTGGARFEITGVEFVDSATFRDYHAEQDS